MLITAKDLQSYKLTTLECEIGTVEEIYFDDRFWIVRYLVADTYNWLTGRKVLVAPYALSDVDTTQKIITVGLTETEIENSPILPIDQPLSHELEKQYCGHFGWPEYWNGPHAWGISPYLKRVPPSEITSYRSENSWSPHLLGTFDFAGSHIQATDGAIGHISGFIIDDESWVVRYLIIDTHNWWSGNRLLVSPQWIERISWSESNVILSLSRQSIKDSPKYNEQALLTRHDEAMLYGHYDREGYWVGESYAKEISY